jgi:hypothetical protein
MTRIQAFAGRPKSRRALAIDRLVESIRRQDVETARHLFFCFQRMGQRVSREIESAYWGLEEGCR